MATTEMLHIQSELLKIQHKLYFSLIYLIHLKMASNNSKSTH